MTGKKAGIFLLGASVILATLMVTHVVTFIAGVFIFAVALVVFGVPSHGFRRTW